MKELLLLKELDQKYRQVCGLYKIEKNKALSLQKKVEELESQLEEVCRAYAERYNIPVAKSDGI